MHTIKIFMNKNKNKLYFVGLLIIIFSLLFFLNNKTNNSEKKIFKVPTIIIEKKEKNNIIPFININTNDVNRINNKILETYNNAILDNKKNKFSYKSNINKNILYVLTETTKYSEDNTYYNKVFNSYYIDLKTKNVLDDEYVLNLNKKNKTEIENTINNILLEKYNIEKDNGYIIAEDCNYTCYLNYHDLDNLNSRIVYYYNDKLQGYLNYTLETVYFDPTDYIKIPYIYSF